MKRKSLLQLEILLLGSLLLTGCHSKRKEKEPTTTKIEESMLDTEETISSNEIKNYSFIVLYNYDKRITEYHIVLKNLIIGEEEPNYACYDILTNDLVFIEPTEEIIEPTEEVLDTPNIYKVYELPINYYIKEENINKDYYTKEDIRIILLNLKDYYENISNQKTRTLKKD